MFGFPINLPNISQLFPSFTDKPTTSALDTKIQSAALRIISLTERDPEAAPISSLTTKPSPPTPFSTPKEALREIELSLGKEAVRHYCKRPFETGWSSSHPTLSLQECLDHLHTLTDPKEISTFAHSILSRIPQKVALHVDYAVCRRSVDQLLSAHKKDQYKLLYETRGWISDHPDRTLSQCDTLLEGYPLEKRVPLIKEILETFKKLKLLE